jgi:chitinase
MGNTSNLAVASSACSMDILLRPWLSSSADVVQSLAVPSFMLQSVVEDMEGARELGEEAEKQAAKNSVLSAAVTADLVQMARLIAIVGITGNNELGTHDIVDPRMAPLPVLGLLTGARLKAPKKFKEAEVAKWAMIGDNIASLRTKFAKQDAVI